MSLRFTMSKDRRKRASFNVRCRFDRDEVITSLCWHMKMTEIEELPDRMSRAAIEEVVKRALYHDGKEGQDYWTDSLSEDEVDAITEWATRVFDQAYPEAQE